MRDSHKGSIVGLVYFATKVLMITTVFCGDSTNAWWKSMDSSYKGPKYHRVYVIFYLECI